MHSVIILLLSTVGAEGELLHGGPEPNITFEFDGVPTEQNGEPYSYSDTINNLYGDSLTVRDISLPENYALITKVTVYVNMCPLDQNGPAPDFIFITLESHVGLTKLYTNSSMIKFPTKNFNFTKCNQKRDFPVESLVAEEWQDWGKCCANDDNQDGTRTRRRHVLAAPPVKPLPKQQQDESCSNPRPCKQTNPTIRNDTNTETRSGATFRNRITRAWQTLLLAMLVLTNAA